MPSVTAQGLKVALFRHLYQRREFPDTPKAVVTLLERLGCTVEFPLEQTCCGQLFTNTGYYDAAVPRTSATTSRRSSPTTTSSGRPARASGAVRHQHPMLAEHSGDAGLTKASQEVALRTYDISEFLVDVLEMTDVGAYFRIGDLSPHLSLGASGQGGGPALQLLSKVKGLDLVPLPGADQCCGFGGTFSVKNPDVSVAMGSDKARNVRSTGAEYLVTGDNACLMHHRHHTPPRTANARVKPIHLAEILAQTEAGAR